jgi:hypothetical protein
MADSKVTLVIENWIRQNYLHEKYGQLFDKKKLALTPGGSFEFDAVSKNESIVASISTSANRTAGGKKAPGPFRKILADILYLTMIDDTQHKVNKRLIVFTEKDLHGRFLQEFNAGRIPKNVEFILVEHIPADLRKQLAFFRSKASKEVSPFK